MFPIRALLTSMALLSLIATGCSDPTYGPSADTDSNAAFDLGAGDSLTGDLGPKDAPGDGPGNTMSDGTSSDQSTPKDSAPDTKLPPLGPGLKWVRNHKMMISGLAVSVGAPSAGAAGEYFNSFNANTIHLWADGLPGIMNGWLTHKPGANWISWVDKNGNSAANSKPIGGYPAGKTGRVGYQIGDEPGDMAGLKVMEAGVKVVRAADPSALIYLNFNTAATTQMLDYYLKMDCDVISYDQYTRNSNSYQMRELIRTYGLKMGVPYWRYIKSYYATGDSTITESDMRWDAFSGLVYGYTGHTWFIYQIGYAHPDVQPAFFTAPNIFSTKTNLYSTAAKINAELANLGRCVTQLTSTDVRYISAVPFVQPKLTKPWSKGAGGDPYIAAIAGAPGTLLLEISVGYFKDDAGQRYVMVQNTRRKRGPWPVNNGNKGTIRISFDFSKASAGFDKTKLLSLSKTTGKQGALPLTALGGGKARLDVTLAAGDPVLFKYNTGPFKLGP